jgi:O-antigen/teichoic acid export membrane protein
VYKAKKDLLLKKLKSSKSLGSLTVRVIGFALSFLMTIVLTRILSPQGYGTFSYALSLLSFLAVPLITGLPTITVRETAKAKISENWANILAVRGFAVRRIFTYCVYLFAIGLTAFLFTHAQISKERQDVFLTGIITIPLLSIMLVNSAQVRGLNKVFQGLVSELIIRPLTILLCLTLVLTLNLFGEITPQIAMGLYVFGVLVSLGISVLILKKYLPKKMNLSSLKMDKKKWRQAATSLSIIGTLQMVNNYSDVLILGAYHDDNEVGIYRAMTQLGIVVVIGLTAINQKLHPQISKLYFSNQKEKLQEVINRSWLIINILALIPGLALIFAGDIISSLLFGEDFVSKTGVISLMIISFGLLVNTFFGSVGSLLNMTGHENYSLRGMAIGILINLIISFALIPKFGMYGAAIANAISLAIWNMILHYYVWKKLGVQSIGILKTKTQRQ